MGETIEASVEVRLAVALRRLHMLIEEVMLWESAYRTLVARLDMSDDGEEQPIGEGSSPGGMGE